MRERVRVVTDCRMDPRMLFMATAVTPSTYFADRSLVRAGCPCDYCTWTPPIVPLMSTEETL